MKIFQICVISVLSVIFFPFGNGGNILFLAPLGSKSHKIFFMGITEALAKRGHQVTMVSPFEPFKKLENVREVVIQNFSVDAHLKDAFDGKHNIVNLFSEGTKLCLDGLRQEKVQELKEEKFDLVLTSIFFGYCYLSFVHHFKVPFIFVSASGLFGSFHDLVGNIDFPSISGHIILEPGFPLTFGQRLKGAMADTYFRIMFTYYGEYVMYSECLKSGLCPPDMPPISELNRNASLVIINRVRALESPPRPVMPNVIYAGGAHIKAAKPLPKDLEDWVRGSGDDGFIFFSLGSALNPSFLPEEYRKILVKVFGSLKQKVLWKWNEETMPDLPSNVKLQKWLPQPDLLGHPKIKLFITHGGQLSTLEASFHGVPVIGMPVMADQHHNMKLVQSEGWGRVVNWKTLEEKAFINVLLETLNNKTVIEIAKHKSSLMRDRLVPPDEEATYWIEYVMRHKGAPHLASPLKLMKWYEVYNADVWIFISLVIVAIVYILYLVIKFTLNRCLGIGKSEKKKD